MLAISPLKSLDGGDGIERAGEILFEDINFDDLFEGLEDGDILPDLEIDPSDIFADFSFYSSEESGNREKSLEENGNRREDCKESSREEVEVVSARTKEDVNKGSKASMKGSKASSHGKKKAKVDWTPELHRRFVQAVEQLGVDKAVPSRILELMGIDCLTRHNIASHLQKYRSHRKHLQVREAEASWSHRRQMYSTSAAVHGAGPTKMNINPNWAPPPIIGFPSPMHQPPLVRPLHVWGHPSVEQLQLVPLWPRPPWGAPQPAHGVPPPDPSYWHRYQRPLTQGTPCFPPLLMPATRFPTPPVHGIPPHPMYRPAPPPIKKSCSQVRLDAQPSNESIDAAIGDVLAKPWLPLPLGLKPPSLDSVMVELQKRGVPKVP